MAIRGTLPQIFIGGVSIGSVEDLLALIDNDKLDALIAGGEPG